MLTRRYRWIAVFVLLSTLAVIGLPAYAQEGTVPGTVPGTLPETGSTPTAWPALLVLGLLVGLVALQIYRQRQSSLG